ncbi:MAG: class I SAM-dependent methyltransferase [Pseudomonadota bacterium]
MKICASVADLDPGLLGSLPLACVEARPEGEWHLYERSGRLELHAPEWRPRDSGCWLDLDEVTRRLGARSELLRACLGRAAGGATTVLDPFAGWGVDALCLAARGATVRCTEREPAMVALLRDALRRGPPAWRERVQVDWAEASSALADPAPVDLVYLDPMFPPRRKGALPNKRLQWLARLGDLSHPTGDADTELADWLRLARRRATDRVVVKRRRRDPVLATPEWRILGTAVRYDIYRPL